MKLSAVRGVLAASLLLLGSTASVAQSASTPKVSPPESSKRLEKEFFGAIREGDAGKVLSYIPKSGVNFGPVAHHLTRGEVEQQFREHRGLYCNLFDSSCIDATINLANSARLCSDREMLTHSEKVRTASSEITRNEVHQAVLVAEVKNDQCANAKLIDFIFNLDAEGWKLFSIP